MKKPLAPLTAALLVFTPLLCSAADWPQWRGPNRDAVISDPNHPLNTLSAEPKISWRIDAGLGQSSPVVSAGKVVFLDGVNGQETAHCLDAKTGKELWKTAFAPMVQFPTNHGDGPRCTPIIEEDRVYVQSCSGEFRCLSLTDGSTIWKLNFERDYGATFFGAKNSDPAAKETASRRHGNNGSAVIDGDRVFIPVGSPDGATLVACDKKTGKELWRAGNDNTAYSSLMVATMAGTRQVLHFTADALMGVGSGNGKILWRVPLKTGAKRHVCTPVVFGDSVIVNSTNIGTLKFTVTKEGEEFKATQTWANLPIKTIIGTPVLKDGLLYTLGAGSRADLVCVDFETGQSLWSQPGFGDYASLTVVNDKLLVLNSTGELFLIKASKAGYEELGRLQACGKTWASPAYAGGKLYVKDDAYLTSLDL